MKRNLQTSIIAVAFVLSAISSSAQWINSITYSPAVPTPSDTIYFYTDLMFSTGTCDQHTQYLSVAPPYVFASALHCTGMLTVICNYTDTFKVNPLSVGTYTFIFHVDAGSLPSPCTPGIIAGPTDSISFTVNAVTSVSGNVNEKNEFIIYPNPVKDILNLKLNKEIASIKNKSLVIYSLEGKELLSMKLENEIQKHTIDIPDIKNGVYFCTISGNSFISDKMKLTLIK